MRPGRQAGEKGIRIHQLRPIDLARGVPAEQAIDQIQRFIGSRPLVGYYLQFDDRCSSGTSSRSSGFRPNQHIEVSTLCYDAKQKRLPPGSNIDLRFATIRDELDLPEHAKHDACKDALLAAMMYLRPAHPGRRK